MIQRKRFVIMRNNRTEILCGSGKNIHYAPIDKTRNSPICTFPSKKNIESKAHYRDYEIVPIIETIEWNEEDKYD